MKQKLDETEADRDQAQLAMGEMRERLQQMQEGFGEAGIKEMAEQVMRASGVSALLSSDPSWKRVYDCNGMKGSAPASFYE